jgi:hypothetical protein
MSSHDVTLAIYSALAVAVVGVELRSRKPGSRIPSLGRAFSRMMRTRSGRVGIVAGWVWLGLHFFAR